MLETVKKAILSAIKENSGVALVRAAELLTEDIWSRDQIVDALEPTLGGEIDRIGNLDSYIKCWLDGIPSWQEVFDVLNGSEAHAHYCSADKCFSAEYGDSEVLVWFEQSAYDGHAGWLWREWKTESLVNPDNGLEYQERREVRNETMSMMELEEWANQGEDQC